jgi:hypothetical protein
MRLSILILAVFMAAVPAVSFAQKPASGDPAAGSASTGTTKSNPSGSGTSTSGGKDANGDQGRDKTGTSQKQMETHKKTGAPNGGK